MRTNFLPIPIQPGCELWVQSEVSDWSVNCLAKIISLAIKAHQCFGGRLLKAAELDCCSDCIQSLRGRNYEKYDGKKFSKFIENLKNFCLSWKIKLNKSLLTWRNKHFWNSGGITQNIRAEESSLSCHHPATSCLVRIARPSLSEREGILPYVLPGPVLSLSCSVKLDGIGPADNPPRTSSTTFSYFFWDKKFRNKKKKKNVFKNKFLHVTCDTWHMTCDMWNVICDTWHKVWDDHSLKLSAP